MTLTLTSRYIKYVGQWPNVFCITVILPCILNTIWWTSLILWILVQFAMAHWPIFHDLLILSYIPISAFVEVWYENFYECSKVRNRPLFLQDVRQAHPCILDTFLVQILLKLHLLLLERVFLVGGQSNSFIVMSQQKIHLTYENVMGKSWWLQCMFWKTSSLICINYLSRDMTKPTKWLCTHRRLRSAWASTKSDQSLRCALNE